MEKFVSILRQTLMIIIPLTFIGLLLFAALFYFDKLPVFFGNLNQELTTEIVCIATNTYHYGCDGGECRESLKVSYTYTVNRQKHDGEFTVSLGRMPEAREKYKTGSRFRGCYDPQRPQFSYIPDENKKCGEE